MGISSLKKSASDNWELLSTSSPAGVATITFSSIDTVFSKLLLTYDLTSSGNSGFLTLRVNNDAGNNYMSNAIATENDSAGGGAASYDTNEHICCVSSGFFQTSWSGNTIILAAETTSIKTLESFGTALGGTAGCGTTAFGIYMASAAVTQLDLKHSANLTGTVKLYGVRI